MKYINDIGGGNQDQFFIEVTNDTTVPQTFYFAGNSAGFQPNPALKVTTNYGEGTYGLMYLANFIAYNPVLIKNMRITSTNQRQLNRPFQMTHTSGTSQTIQSIDLGRYVNPYATSGIIDFNKPDILLDGNMKLSFEVLPKTTVDIYADYASSAKHSNFMPAKFANTKYSYLHGRSTHHPKHVGLHKFIKLKLHLEGHRP